MKIIILCGGTGTRLWPMSRRKLPKQFFPIISALPMVKETYNRFRNDFDVSDIYFSTNPVFVEKLKEIFPQSPDENFIVEPEKRDTAPAMGFACAYLMEKYPDEPVIFIASDHYIRDQKRFIETVKLGEKLIKKTNKLLDIAIEPDFASTILGYTRIGSLYATDNDIEVYNFKGHTEKPDKKTAQEYLQAGDYLWHANFYMWTPRLFLQAFKEHAPDHYHHLAAIVEYLKAKDSLKISQSYSQMEKISLDYAITEKINQDDVLIIKGDFGWSDIGAWDVLHNHLPKNSKNNLIKGKAIACQTTNSLIYNSQDKLITVMGMDNLVVVDTGDSLLICPKDNCQQIKKLIDQIEDNNFDQYL